MDQSAAGRPLASSVPEVDDLSGQVIVGSCRQLSRELLNCGHQRDQSFHSEMMSCYVKSLPPLPRIQDVVLQVCAHNSIIGADNLHNRK